MPLKDVDGGLNFQFYNPHMFTGRLPREQSVSKPFYFGGSQVPTELGLSPSSSGKVSRDIKTKSVKKLPFMRK